MTPMEMNYLKMKINTMKKLLIEFYEGKMIENISNNRDEVDLEERGNFTI